MWRWKNQIIADLYSEHYYLLDSGILTEIDRDFFKSVGVDMPEVFDALEEYGFRTEKEQVKHWYDGFIFGSHKDIYNP